MAFSLGVIDWAVAACVTIIGGFTAIAYTDSIQTGIIVLGCSLMAFIGLHHVGGWHNLVVRVPQAMHIAKAYDDPNYPFWGVILSAFYGGIFYWGVDQVNVQRVLGARDVDQARWGGMFTTLLKLFPVFIFALPGVIALALFPGRESKTTFVTLLNELHQENRSGRIGETHSELEDAEGKLPGHF
jgi:SSS family solute:Na+ symporter